MLTAFIHRRRTPRCIFRYQVAETSLGMRRDPQHDFIEPCWQTKEKNLPKCPEGARSFVVTMKRMKMSHIRENPLICTNRRIAMLLKSKNGVVSRIRVCIIREERSVVRAHAFARMPTVVFSRLRRCKMNSGTHNGSGDCHSHREWPALSA